MDAKARDRCLKEVKLLQTLPAHPCIIRSRLQLYPPLLPSMSRPGFLHHRYIDSFIDSNELYIVFEWVATTGQKSAFSGAGSCRRRRGAVP